MSWIRSFSLLPLRMLSYKRGAEFLDLDRVCMNEQHEAVQALLPHAERNHGVRAHIRKSVSEIENTIPHTEVENGERQGRVYDIEYANNHYAFASPLLIPELFELITGTKIEHLPASMITDVGAGSGELERFLLQHGVPPSRISCIDPSLASIERLRSWGITGEVGTLGPSTLPDSSQQMTFLSYFIDYDAAQSETFDAAVRITAPGGRIVFEGLLPAHMQVPSGEKAVTRGWFATDDMTRIADAVQRCGVLRDKKVILERVAYGHRSVYSRYGMRSLPTTFLTFTVHTKVDKHFDTQ
jgi:SAM-dependent methyltransferase